MPSTIAADGVRIHYEVTGPPGGEPLLMIQGLGADHRGWVLQQGTLARHYRCIVFDNRGVGRSGKPHGAYDLEVMAADAAAVLDACGVDRAHVVGASMGGVIAQILAVRRPERVRSLVLACTACRHHPWRVELLEDWARTVRQGGMGALTNRALRWLVGPRFRRRLYVPARLFGSLLTNVPAHGFAGQVEGILAMSDDMRAELDSIAVPTLVLVGSQDILTPRGDAEEVAERIPGAELVVLPGAAHALMVEQPATFNRLVLGFLQGRAGGTGAPGERTDGAEGDLPDVFPAAGA